MSFLPAKLRFWRYRFWISAIQEGSKHPHSFKCNPNVDPSIQENNSVSNCGSVSDVFHIPLAVHRAGDSMLTAHWIFVQCGFEYINWKVWGCWACRQPFCPLLLFSSSDAVFVTSVQKCHPGAGYEDTSFTRLRHVPFKSAHSAEK